MKKNSPENTTELTPRQRKIILKLQDDLDVVRDYNGKTFKEICDFEKKDPQVIEEIFNDFRISLLQSIRADLHVHPLTPPDVKDVLLGWLYTHQALGSKQLLRKAKRGLEVGVKRPLKIEKVELKNAVEYLRLHKKEVETVMEDNNASTLEEILQKIRLTSIYDPDNLPSQSEKPMFWAQVHSFLMQRGVLDQKALQVFLREARRLSPSLFPRPKEPKDQSKKE